jgi:superfamily II DNA or RNA helicase
MPTDFVAWDKIQQDAKDLIRSSFREVDCLVAAAPTGFGKTRLGANLIKGAVAHGTKWVWSTHRKTLTTQTLRSFQEQGLDFGVRASGLADLADITKPGQIAMLQSERAAVKAGKRQLHDAKLVIVDEAHANKTGYSEEVIRHHLDAGAKVLLLSATPVGLGHLGQKLINLAYLSDMRKIGALLPAESFSPPEFELKHVKKIASGDYSPLQQSRMVMRQQVVGDIYKHYLNLNSHQVPTIGFGPDVKSSMYLCDEFNRRGIKAAHIDGQDVYLGEHDLHGEPIIYKSSQKMRDYVFSEVEAGRIKIIWNRFVMREGVDIPCLGHAIFACSSIIKDGSHSGSWRQLSPTRLRQSESGP